MLALAPMIELLLPEIVLLSGATAILLTGVSKTLSRSATILATVVILSALGVTSLRHNNPELLATAGASVDALNPGFFANYVRMIVLAVGLLIVFANRHVPEEGERAEFVALTMFSLAGVMLVALANNLILLFLALELVSVPTYILIGLSRRDIEAQEATAKYFFLGAFAAAITLYGFSFLYGATGHLRLFGADSISAWFIDGGSVALANDGMFLLGVLLSLGGLAFKLAAAPFHFYVADVYQGAAAAVTGMLGFVPKFAGMVAAIHIVGLTQWNLSGPVFWGLWILAAATMTVGNSLAFMQYNVKRMLAYSGVAHSGYMLMALLIGPGQDDGGTAIRNGLAAILFYMAVYGIANLGAFCTLAWFRKPGRDDAYQSAELLEDLSGTGRTHRWPALALALCVLALMGFPLTGGFLGKLYIFGSVFASINDQPQHATALVALVAIGAINAAVGAAYYLRIIASCYWDAPREGRLSPTPCSALQAVWVVCGLLVPVLFFFPGTLARNAVSAARDSQMRVAQSSVERVARLGDAVEARDEGEGIGTRPVLPIKSAD